VQKAQRHPAQCLSQLTAHSSYPYQEQVKRQRFPHYMPLRHIGGVEVQLYSFLTSAFDEVGWSMLCPCRFTPGKRPRFPFYRRNGGPWDWSGQMQTISHPPGFKPQTASLVAICYTDYTINFSSTFLNYKIYYSSII